MKTNVQLQYVTYRSILFSMQNILNKPCREIQRRILCSTTFTENPAVYKLM